MIQPNELRIGNHIEQGVIFEIKQNVVRVKYNGRTSLLVHEELKTIQLTEEILLKCGFVKSIKEDFKLMLKMCGINLYCRFNTEWYFELEGIYLGAKPKYLHELQNLYFSLLGTELTINL